MEKFYENIQRPSSVTQALFFGTFYFKFLFLFKFSKFHKKLVLNRYDTEEEITEVEEKIAIQKQRS